MFLIANGGVRIFTSPWSNGVIKFDTLKKMTYTFFILLLVPKHIENKQKIRKSTVLMYLLNYFYIRNNLFELTITKIMTKAHKNEWIYTKKGFIFLCNNKWHLIYLRVRTCGIVYSNTVEKLNNLSFNVCTND